MSATATNVFFRDIQYGIQTMLDRKNMSVGYADAEKIARSFAVQLDSRTNKVESECEINLMNCPAASGGELTPE